MAATLVLDIPGTIESRGVSFNKYDRAVRRGMYKVEPTDLVGNLKTDAVNRFIADAGLFHHNMTTLPLARLTARQWGPYRILLTGEYFRTSTTFSGPNTAYVFAEFRGAVRATEWVQRSYNIVNGNAVPSMGPDGTPNGIIEFINDNPFDGATNPSAIPRVWIWRQHGWAIYVNTVLGFNPINRVLHFRNTINGNTASFGGFNFPPGSVLFRDIAVTQVNTIQGPRFIVRYAFETYFEGFKTQTAYFDTSSGTGGFRDVVGDEHRRADWGPGFPV